MGQKTGRTEGAAKKGCTFLYCVMVSFFSLQAKLLNFLMNDEY